MGPSSLPLVRRRGAQPGNTNALKHGRTSARAPLPVSALPKIEEEKRRIRALLAGLLDASLQVNTLPEHLAVLRAACLYVSDLISLVRAETLASSHPLADLAAQLASDEDSLSGLLFALNEFEEVLPRDAADIRSDSFFDPASAPRGFAAPFRLRGIKKGFLPPRFGWDWDKAVANMPLAASRPRAPCAV